MYFHDKALATLVEKSDVVVFDMNGTLVDDEPVQLRATNEVLKPFGIQLDEADFISRCVGIKTRVWMSEMLPGVSKDRMDAMLDEREAAYARIAANEISALERPGVIGLLRFASAHPEKKIALATSSPMRNAEVIVGGAGLDVFELFDFVITGQDVKNAKPDPEMYNRVRAAFPGTENFLVIEDTWAGVTAAKAANMSCIAFPSDFTRGHDHSAADVIVDSMLPDATPRGAKPAPSMQHNP